MREATATRESCIQRSFEALSRQQLEVFAREIHQHFQEERRLRQELLHTNTRLKQTFEHLQEAQTQVVQLDRLAAIGQLAAGVAHEVNNPLAVVLKFSQILLDLDAEESARRDIRIVFEHAQRAQKILQDLLFFSRQHNSEKTATDVAQVLETALKLKVHDLWSNHMEVELDCAPDMPWAVADGQQLEQVFMNIVTNAQDAMADANGRGKLSIQGRRSGNNLRITFADNGPGISNNNLRRVFDPFFTTKANRGGTGLGLSVSYGIVLEHGGRLWAESGSGRGAVFHIELPGLPTTGRRRVQNRKVAKNGHRGKEGD